MTVYQIVVSDDEDAEYTRTRLIEAKNEAQAIKHAVKAHMTVSRPTSAELVALGKAGVEIERVAE